MSESVKEMTSKFGKLEKFQGVDFRRWQKKMHFLLTTLKVVYVLSTPRPAEPSAYAADVEPLELKSRPSRADGSLRPINGSPVHIHADGAAWFCQVVC